MSSHLLSQGWLPAFTGVNVSFDPQPWEEGAVANPRLQVGRLRQEVGAMEFSQLLSGFAQS